MIYPLLICLVLAYGASEFAALYDARSIHLGIKLHHKPRHKFRLGFLLLVSFLLMQGRAFHSPLQAWAYMLHGWALLVSVFFLAFDIRLNQRRPGGLAWYYVSPSNQWDSFWLRLTKDNVKKAGQLILCLELLVLLLLLPLWLWLWL